MLHYTTIQPRTLQLLKQLQQLDILQDFILVGGTSLALQIGHRISIDLDLFTTSTIDISTIPNYINQFGNLRIVNQTPYILNLYIDDIKVDFVAYRYPFLTPFIIQDGLKLATITDIAAMKLAAIVGRGSRKDFIDLFFILEHFSLSELLDFYKQKYPDSSDFLVFKSLTYFEDAELEPMPKMLKSINWEEIKAKIIEVVRDSFP